jgi:hypothetical protein
MSITQTLGRRIPLPRARREHVALALGLLFPALYFFRDAVFLGRLLFRRDLNMVWLPQVETFVNCIGRGAWPLWDRFSAFGRPLLADPRAEILYPFTWLNLIMSPARYIASYAVFHLIFSGAGLALLARRLGLPPFSAYLAGVVWIGSGPFLSLISQWHHFAAAAWIPWIFLAADVALHSGRVRDGLLWGSALALQVFAGSPDIMVLMLPPLALFVIARAGAHGRFRLSKRTFRAATIAVVTGLALSAAQWMPTLEWLQRTKRADAVASAEREQQDSWSVHPAALEEVALPVPLIELPLQAAHQERLLAMKEPWLHSLYLGIPALILLCVGTIARGPRRWWLILSLAAALLYSCGRHTPFFGIVTTLFPPLRLFRYPVKAMIVAAFTWSLLVGLGHAALCSAAPRDRRRLSLSIILPATICLVFCLGAIAVIKVHPGPFRALFTNAHYAFQLLSRRLAITAVLSGAMLALGLLLTRISRSAAPLSLALIALAAGPLIVVHRHLQVTISTRAFATPPPSLAEIRHAAWPRIYVRSYVFEPARREVTIDPSVYRIARRFRGLSDYESMVLGVHHYLNPPTAARWSIAGSYDWDIMGFDTKHFSEIAAFLEATEGEPTHVKLLRMGGVTHALALAREGWWAELIPRATYSSVFRDDMHLFEVPSPLPRAYVVSGARVAEGAAALKIIRDAAFDPRREIVLAAGTPAAAAEPPGECRLRILDPDRALIEADLARPGYVVLLEAFDPGWRATIDGQALPVLRANVTFRAVHAPAGRHVIEFVYRPRAVLLGAAVSLTSLLLVAVAWALTRNERRAVPS